MKKVTMFLLSSVLLFGAVACGGAQTGANAPDTTGDTAQAPQAGATSSPEASTQTPKPEEAKDNQEDATSEVRKKQLESDIRAREQRNNVTGGDADRADGDLESEVRSKLEANLPASGLTIKAEEGVVTISGTVPTQPQFDKIATLAKEIKGVKSVDVKATVAPAKAQQDLLQLIPFFQNNATHYALLSSNSFPIADQHFSVASIQEIGIRSNS